MPTKEVLERGSVAAAATKENLETMGNNGKQWESMGNNGKQWETMT